jgi:hypothetical protein
MNSFSLKSADLTIEEAITTILQPSTFLHFNLTRLTIISCESVKLITSITAHCVHLYAKLNVSVLTFVFFYFFDK